MQEKIAERYAMWQEVDIQSFIITALALCNKLSFFSNFHLMIVLEKIYILWGKWNFLFSLIIILEWHARKTNKQMLWFPQCLLLETEMNVMLFQQKNYFLMKRKLTKRSVIFVENSLEQFLHYCDQTLRRWDF